jgi:hypothetical protein
MTYRCRAIAEPSKGPARGSLPNEIETVKRYCQFVRESLTAYIDNKPLPRRIGLRRQTKHTFRTRLCGGMIVANHYGG